MESQPSQTIAASGVPEKYDPILPPTKARPVGKADQSTRKALSSVDKNSLLTAPVDPTSNKAANPGVKKATTKSLPKASAKRSHDESENQTENPAKKQKAKKDAKSQCAGTEPKTKAATKGKKGYTYDVDDIHLDGEETGTIPIFDTCDDVRRKINAHLRADTGTTQAGFMREATKALPEGSKVVSNQMGRFLAKKGPTHGATTEVFYYSYVLLEKMRLKAGKPKSKKRLEMEQQWASEGGMDRTHDSKTSHYLCRADERPHEDQYGKMHFG